MGFRGAPPATDPPALVDLVDVDAPAPAGGDVPIFDELTGVWTGRRVGVDDLAPGSALEGDVPTFDESAGVYVPRPLPVAPTVVYHGTEAPENARPAADHPWSLYVQHSS